jgi:predicted TIM-barrel fold metal-dependent hydrolase
MVDLSSVPSPALAEWLESVPLVDHHVHGAFTSTGSRSRFENALNEGSITPLPDFVSGFDSQLGFAVRRWCSPLLDLERHAPADEYWQRRTELGEPDVNRRFLTAAGVSDWLVDTGYSATALETPARMAEITGARSCEVVRLESIAERLLLDGPDNYADRFRTALAEAAAGGAVGTKSVLAYRTGFDIDYRRPSDTEVAAAASAWASAPRQGDPRLTDPRLIVFGLFAAIDARLSLQVHVGFGDSDLDLHRCNPMLLLPFLRATEVTAVPVLLLHCYPFEREAGYLASSFGHVYLDVGLAVNHLGARSVELVARSYELAPFAKVLYSSDAWGPSELHYLGARLWRNAVSTVVGGWVARDEWSLPDARRVVEASAHGNARRAYGLPLDR